MRTIHKYPLRLTPEAQTIALRHGSKVLCALDQHGFIYIWVEVNSNEPLTVPIQFWIVGTGHEIPYGADVYVGTVIQGFMSGTSGQNNPICLAQ